VGGGGIRTTNSNPGNNCQLTLAEGNEKEIQIHFSRPKLLYTTKMHPIVAADVFFFWLPTSGSDQLLQPINFWLPTSGADQLLVLNIRSRSIFGSQPQEPINFWQPTSHKPINFCQQHDYKILEAPERGNFFRSQEEAGTSPFEEKYSSCTNQFWWSNGSC
jgi:hypothetical protein